MSLLKYISRGVEIVGLREMLDSGGVAGADFGEVSKGVVDASYDYKSSFFGSGKLTFHKDLSGKTPVRVLPYHCGGINFCNVGGEEVISGPFTGCYMALYNVDGAMRCGHVDTEGDGTGRKPSEEHWKKLAYTTLAERKTGTDEIFDRMMELKMVDANGCFLVGVASSAPVKISFFMVFRINGKYIVQNSPN